MKTDKELGRQDGESDASFELKLQSLYRVKPDKFARKRANSLLKTAKENADGSIIFPDGSMIIQEIKEELNEETDEIETHIIFKVIEK